MNGTMLDTVGANASVIAARTQKPRTVYAAVAGVRTLRGSEVSPRRALASATPSPALTR
jgi:hypothetical protein